MSASCDGRTHDYSQWAEGTRCLLKSAVTESDRLTGPGRVERFCAGGLLRVHVLVRFGRSEIERCWGHRRAAPFRRGFENARGRARINHRVRRRFHKLWGASRGSAVVSEMIAAPCVDDLAATWRWVGNQRLILGAALLALPRPCLGSSSSGNACGEPARGTWAKELNRSQRCLFVQFGP
jgi:hypothetical protein